MGRLFGTDGIRGIANETLNCETAIKIGIATATVLSYDRKRKTLVLIGMDTRLSGDMLSSAISAGLCSAGADVINIGVVPTPAVAYLVKLYKAQAGVMISASHNPAEFNGIKIFNEEGYKLADELEERIESIVLDDTPLPFVANPENIGRIRYNYSAYKDYISYLKSTVASDLSGIYAVVDSANGSATTTSNELFSELGMRCTHIADSPNGENINDNCGSTHIDVLRKAVLDCGSDIGIAFDGDADRCLLIDEKGNEVDGDMIMAMLALDMKQRNVLSENTVVGTVMSNFGFSKFCEDNGINFISTKVGDRYVLEEMLQEGYNLGGEQSGHIIFKNLSSTGDGQLTALQVLDLLARKKKKLSELAGVMKRFPQYIYNVPATQEEKLAFFTDPDVKSIIENAKIVLGKKGRIVVRPSGTEPLIRIMAEGDDEELVNGIAKEIAEKIKEKLVF